MRTAASESPNWATPRRIAARIALAPCPFGVDTPPRARRRSTTPDDRGQRGLDHVDIAGSGGCSKTAPLMIQVANAARPNPMTTAAVSDPSNGIRGVRRRGGAQCARAAGSVRAGTPTQSKPPTMMSTTRRPRRGRAAAQIRQAGPHRRKAEAEPPSRGHREGRSPPPPTPGCCGSVEVAAGRGPRGSGVFLAGRRGWDGRFPRWRRRPARA